MLVGLIARLARDPAFAALVAGVETGGLQKLLMGLRMTTGVQHLQPSVQQLRQATQELALLGDAVPQGSLPACMSGACMHTCLVWYIVVIISSEIVSSYCHFERDCIIQLSFRARLYHLIVMILAAEECKGCECWRCEHPTGGPDSSNYGNHV